MAVGETGGPTNEVLRRLQDLVAFPREGLDTELKGWLNLAEDSDKANLAKAILALANSGGGYILMGFQEKDGGWSPAQPHPTGLTGYSQDIINGVVQRYAEPAFHCEVFQVPAPTGTSIHPVINVPGGHRVPIRAKRDDPDRRHVQQNAYYIRGPGPSSRVPQSGEEWNELIGRCVRNSRENLLDSIRNILIGASPPVASPVGTTGKRLDLWIRESRDRFSTLLSERILSEKPNRYSYGVWSAAYLVVDEFQPPSLGEFLKLLEEAKGHETGWPAWIIPFREGLKPYPFDGNIECWLLDTVFPDPAHSDFWRASPRGAMFLLRGYDEDSQSSELKPGTIFDLTLPIWRVGECLLHAERLTRLLSERSSSVTFRVTWDGLSNRTLTSWANRNRQLWEKRQSHQDSVTSEITLLAENIGATLPEAVIKLTTPLYEIFDFFKPSMELVQEELSVMRGTKIG